MTSIFKNESLMLKKENNSWVSAVRKVGQDLAETQDKMLRLGYEDRIDQGNIMWDIVDHFEDNNNLLIEAGVGIGKSFAYLLPGTLLSLYYGKPLIVASSSIQLTDQLVGDIKSVEEILSEQLNFNEIEYVVAKGRDNYPCTCTVEKKIRHLVTKSEPSEEYEHILEEIKKGAVKQNPMGIKAKYWDEITKHSCDKTRGYNQWNCPLYKMRSELLKPQSYMSNGKHIPKIIVANQNLLMAHYKKVSATSRNILPLNYSALIIDEVHKLEEVVRDTLTTKYDYLIVQELFKRIDYFFGTSRRDKKKNDLVELCKKQLEDYFRLIHENLKDVAKKNDTIEDYDRLDATYNGSLDRYEKVIKSLERLHKEIDISSVSGSVSSFQNNEHKEKESEDILNDIDNLLLFIKLHATNDNEYIVWGKLWANATKYSISYCPDNVDAQIKRILFNNDTPTIGLSATITMDKTYDYIINNIGFEGETSEIYESPFPYDKSRIYIPSNLPAFNKRDSTYFERITDHIVSISENVKGGTLVLFTAKTDLNNVAKLIENKVNKSVHVGLKSSETNSIIKKLKEDKGIVLGTGSFWEGIDLKGEFLTNLIIVRLPFPSPDPVIKRKIEKTSQEEVIVPEMLNKLRQGSGRLIRTNSDIGTCSILDSRMGDIHYKHRNTILKGLPIKNILTSLSELKKFQVENDL